MAIEGDADHVFTRQLLPVVEPLEKWSYVGSRGCTAPPLQLGEGAPLTEQVKSNMDMGQWFQGWIQGVEVGFFLFVEIVQKFRAISNGNL